MADICAMQILIAAATTFEIAPTVEWLKKNASPDRTDVLITGVGLMPAAYQFTRVLRTDKPGLVIQAGIAGTFSKGKHGEVVAIEKDRVADSGVEESGLFKSIFDLQLADPGAFPYTDGWLVNQHRHWLQLSGLQITDAITVNEISTSEARMAAWQQSFHPFVESMEGAALHFCCLMESVPFIQIRSVSNTVGERDKSKWKISLAVSTLNDALISFLQKINSEHGVETGI